MGSVDIESLTSLFLLPDTIAIEAVSPTKTHLTVQVACTLKSAACPNSKKWRMGFATIMRQQRAAFSSEWSNGQVEAQVNCLKLQKRIVFGRANFDLLRLRVLSRV